jgi:hypothetical protein
METNAVSISFDNRVEDQIAADRLYYKSTIWPKIDRIVAAVLVLAGVFLISSAGLRWWTVIPFVLAALEWFNLLSPRPLIIRYWFRNNPKFKETYHLTFDDSGIQFRTNSIDARIAWDQYSKVLENDRLWLLVYGSRMYTVIPKRAFVSEDQIARFRSLVTEQIAADRENP